MRSLFLKIFLWFWAAQILIGASLYALAMTQQRAPDEMLRTGAGASLEAWGRASAIAYESGGKAALRGAWRPSPPLQPGPSPGPQAPGAFGVFGVEAHRASNDDPRSPEGPEDRSRACLYQLGSSADVLASRAATLPTLLIGAPLPPEARGIVAQAGAQGQAAQADENGASWIARGFATSGGGRYVVAVRLYSPLKGFELFRGWNGPGPGPGGPLRWCVAALTMGLVCYALARYVTDPAVKLRRATQQFADGDLSARVGPHLGRRRDELADLGRDFDRMAERIQGLIGAERRLLGDISHELRSPLARMQVALDLVQGTVEGDACKYLERIERESHRLNALIGQLLTLSRLESASATVQREPIDVAQLVAEVVADADFEARSRGRQVILLEAAPCEAMANRELLRSAIENVVRNAARYTHEQTSVEVVLRHEYPGSATAPAGEAASARRAQAVIRMRDYGPGVPEESLERLFDPFYRVEDARDRQSGGVGLGLSITARAVRLHGGEVAAVNAPGGGLLVEIRLPLTAVA